MIGQDEWVPECTEEPHRSQVKRPPRSSSMVPHGLLCAVLRQFGSVKWNSDVESVMLGVVQLLGMEAMERRFAEQRLRSCQFQPMSQPVCGQQVQKEPNQQKPGHGVDGHGPGHGERLEAANCTVCVARSTQVRLCPASTQHPAHECQASAIAFGAHVSLSSCPHAASMQQPPYTASIPALELPEWGGKARPPAPAQPLCWPASQLPFTCASTIADNTYRRSETASEHCDLAEPAEPATPQGPFLPATGHQDFLQLVSHTDGWAEEDRADWLRFAQQLLRMLSKAGWTGRFPSLQEILSHVGRITSNNFGIYAEPVQQGAQQEVEQQGQPVTCLAAADRSPPQAPVGSAAGPAAAEGEGRQAVLYSSPPAAAAVAGAGPAQRAQRAAKRHREELIGRELHIAASFFNHSCAPNCVVHRGWGTARISALRDIKVGS